MSELAASERKDFGAYPEELDLADDVTKRLQAYICTRDVDAHTAAGTAEKTLAALEQAWFATPVEPGLFVQLEGLSAAALNGRRGFADAFDEETGRWKVGLLPAEGAEARTVAVRPANLKRAPILPGRERVGALNKAVAAEKLLAEAREAAGVIDYGLAVSSMTQAQYDPEKMAAAAKAFLRVRSPSTRVEVSNCRRSTKPTPSIRRARRP
jgi:hypothetical protein